jgi:hypothetical protein
MLTFPLANVDLLALVPTTWTSRLEVAHAANGTTTGHRHPAIRIMAIVIVDLVIIAITDEAAPETRGMAVIVI